MKYAQGSFITVPSREVLRGLHPTAQTIYMWLCSYANETGNCFPSRSTLATDARCSDRTVDEMLEILISKGLVRKKGRAEGDKQLSNLYTVMIVDRGEGGSLPPSRTFAPPAKEVRTNSNHLTQPTEVADADAPRVVKVYESEDEKPQKKENRTKDKDTIYALFSSKEEPWMRFAQQKKAALSLFDLEGVEKVRTGRRIMRENIDDPYCPQADTPFDYAQKLPKLKAYAKRNG